MEGNLTIQEHAAVQARGRLVGPPLPRKQGLCPSDGPVGKGAIGQQGREAEAWAVVRPAQASGSSPRRLENFPDDEHGDWTVATVMPRALSLG